MGTVPTALRILAFALLAPLGWVPGAHAGEHAPQDRTVAISAGGNHTCAQRGDGSIRCWGDNTYGQSLAPEGEFLKVDAGGSHTCAIDLDGALDCWGNNSGGRAIPPPGIFIDVSAGGLHSCAIRSNGRAVCWGLNQSGSIYAPQPALFSWIDTGASHSCGVRIGEGAICWGDNHSWQAFAPASPFIQIAAGHSHSCGLWADGRVTCWGSNFSGQRNVPPGSYKAISANGSLTCGIREDDRLSCWGTSFQGLDSPPEGEFIDVSVGTYHACAVRLDGSVACWGERIHGKAPDPQLQPEWLDPIAAGPVDVTIRLEDTTGYLPPSPAFAIVDGGLPAGLSLASDGRITGTAMRSGSHGFTVEAEDANGFVARRSYTLEVTAVPPGGLQVRLNGSIMRATARLTWEGGGASVDVRRNGLVIHSGSNMRAFQETLAPMLFSRIEYQVCNAGTRDCSEIVRVR